MVTIDAPVIALTLAAPLTVTRIFLSHSSDDNELVLRVEQRLKALRHDVLLDISGLEPNRPWRRDLHEWLARCTAGLVLLTQAALARPDWVLKEAIILGFRKDLETQNFGLFWALGPGVSRQQFLDKGFALAQFGDIQRLATTADLDQAEALVDELIARLPAAPAQTPYEQLVDAVSERLLVARKPEITCPKIATHLGLPVPAHWGPDRVQQLAEGVARAIFVSRDQGLQIHQLMTMLKLWDGDDRRQLAELLAPHWVDPEPAARLRAVAERLKAPDRPAAVGIAGAHVQQYTARMYLLRAFGGATVVMAGAVDGRSGDLFADIRHDICDCMRRKRLIQGTPTDDTVVKELRGWPDPIFVPLYSLPDEATLQRLRDEFPQVLFVVGAEAMDTDPPSVVPLAGSPQLQLLEPAPLTAVEQHEADDWKRALKYFIQE